MKFWLIAFAAVASLALSGLYVAVTEAQATKRFIVGQQYGFLYSCIATVGCYGELVTVREVRADGWLVVTAEDQKLWIVNSAQILAVLPMNTTVAAQ